MQSGGHERAPMEITMMRVILSSAILAAICFQAAAQTSYPMLHHLYPCGLQRGSTVEIAVNGEHSFHGAYRVLIEGTGVTAEVVTPEKGWAPPDAKTKVLPE